MSEIEEEKPEKVYWLVDSKENVAYRTTTWYRCMKIQEFVELVEKKSKIMGVIFSGNNLGFILDDDAVPVDKPTLVSEAEQE